MNGPERLLAVLDNRHPDRTPVVPKIWVDLAAALTDTPIMDVIGDPETALRVIVDAGLLAGVDAVRQFHFPPRETEVADGRVYEIRDGRRIGTIDMQGGLKTHLFDAATFDLEDPRWTNWRQNYTADEPFVQTLDDVRRLAVPDRDFYHAVGMGAMQRRVMAHAGRRVAVIGDCQSATLAQSVGFRGMTRALVDLMDDPKLAHALMEKGEAFAIELGKFNLDLGIRVLRLNDSVGNMSVISPAQWREFVFPHMKTVCDELHACRPDARIYCHICGNALPILEDLVETGLDCIGPLDPLGGMRVSDAFGVVGERAALMGGVDTQSFVRKTPDEVCAEASACIAAAGPRYILGSGCVIPRTARLENLQALARAAGDGG